MNINRTFESPEVTKLLWNMAQIGCTVKIDTTGSPYYQRGFIRDPRGVQIGRATIHSQKLDHIKWYWKGYGELVLSDRLRTKYDFLVLRGRILTDYMYDVLISGATVRRDTAYKKKLAERAKTNAHYPKARRAIVKRDIRCFIKF